MKEQARYPRRASDPSPCPVNNISFKCYYIHESYSLAEETFNITCPLIPAFDCLNQSDILGPDRIRVEDLLALLFEEERRRDGDGPFWRGGRGDRGRGKCEEGGEKHVEAAALFLVPEGMDRQRWRCVRPGFRFPQTIGLVYSQNDSRRCYLLEHDLLEPGLSGPR